MRIPSFFAAVPLFAVGLLFAAPASAAERAKPNILWLVNEDHGPHVGSYGDAFATTPTFDALAKRGLRYTKAWSCAPVCAPARTTLISGLYATSTGGEQMRSMVGYPAGLKMYPQLMREAGYYCSNNAKEDYNVANPGKVWDASAKTAHWRKRPAGTPFLAVFNSEKSHESQIRKQPHVAVHDPAKVRVPAYHPDIPEVRKDWAQYYDQVTAADADSGARLKELEEAGLAEDTIVFYYADHGSGMPRSKRWPYNSGLQVPLIVYIPEKFKDLRPADYQAGGTSDRLVSFVDFAPTLLSLAGVKPPEWLQGSAFLGKFIGPAPKFLHGFRGRMDERLDLVRSVTDGRFVYIRNYLPHLIYGQHIDYMFQTPTTPAWKKLHDEGRLNAQQDAFWQEKAPEELYDLKADPDEVKNLAGSAVHQEIKAALRKAQQEHIVRIRDVGFIPEGVRFELAKGGSPYDVGHDRAKYDLARVVAAAELASMRDPKAAPELAKLLTDADPSIRYWAALGIYMRGQPAVQPAETALKAALADKESIVRVHAAHCLAQFGEGATAKQGLAALVELAHGDRNNYFTAMAALNALDQLGDKATPQAAAIRALPGRVQAPAARYAEYLPRLVMDLQKRFQ